MTLDDFGSTYSEEAVREFSKQLLEKHGELACRCAEELEATSLDSGTLTTYKAQVRQIISHTEERVPDAEDVAEFISDSEKKGSTKNIMVMSMKSYYNAIGEQEYADELHELSKQLKIDEINYSKGMDVDEWLTRDEFEDIKEYILPDKGETANKIDGAGQTHIINLQHKALVNALFYTGNRVGELCRRHSDDWALSVEDLYPEDSQIKMYRLKKKGKGAQRDYKVVPDELFEVLDEYLDWAGIDEGHIFPFTRRTAQNRISEIDKAYKFLFGDFKHTEKLTPHKFRHGRITDIANNSGLDEAGEYVEHSSSDITKQYRHLTADVQKEALPEFQDEEEDSADELLQRMMEKAEVDSPEELLEELEDN